MFGKIKRNVLFFLFKPVQELLERSPVGEPCPPYADVLLQAKVLYLEYSHSRIHTYSYKINFF